MIRAPLATVVVFLTTIFFIFPSVIVVNNPS